jgi:hypothetical protein
MDYDFDHHIKKELNTSGKLKALDKFQDTLRHFFYDSMPEMRLDLIRLCYMACEFKKRLDYYYCDGITYFYRNLTALINVVSYVYEENVLELVSDDPKYAVTGDLRKVEDLISHYRFKKNWRKFPMYLMLEHVEDPISFIEDFFRYKTKKEWKKALDELFDNAICRSSIMECNDIIDNPIKIFIYLARFMDCLFLIKIHIERIKDEKDSKETPTEETPNESGNK